MKESINIYVVLVLLFTHWVADFVLQTDKQAQGKSKNWNDLLSHTLTYSTVFMFLTAIWVGFKPNPSISDLKWVLFPLITLVCHTITDYYTSRINSRLWADKKVHNFFVSIGFDQFLHFAQLLITYQLLAA